MQIEINCIETWTEILQLDTKMASQYPDMILAIICKWPCVYDMASLT